MRKSRATIADARFLPCGDISRLDRRSFKSACKRNHNKIATERISFNSKNAFSRLHLNKPAAQYTYNMVYV